MTSMSNAGPSIRPAGLGDYEALCALWEMLDEQHRQALPDKFHVPLGPRRELSYVDGLIRGPDSTIIVAERGQSICGFVTLVIKHQPETELLKARAYIEIDNMIVDPAGRRCGIGRALMCAADAWAAQRGSLSLELGVHHFNRAAIEFYQAVGFEMAAHRMRRVTAHR